MPFTTVAPVSSLTSASIPSLVFSWLTSIGDSRVETAPCSVVASSPSSRVPT